MAKPNGNGDAGVITLTKDDVAKLINATVVVPVLDKAGKRVSSRDPQDNSLVYRNETVRARGEHIHSFRIDGNEVVALTVDGQRIRAAIA